MDYEKIYKRLIAYRRNVKLTKNKRDPSYVYCERHHIVPRCMNGNNDSKNLVNLTAREHYIAHLLLRKMFPKNIGLSIAVELMKTCSMNMNRTFRFNSRLFEKIKIYNS